MKLIHNKEIIHFSQLNNLNEPFAACFPTSLAMALRNNGVQFPGKCMPLDGFDMSKGAFDDYIFALAKTSKYKDMAKSQAIPADAKLHQYPAIMCEIANSILKLSNINLKAKRVPYNFTVVKKFIDAGIMVVCGTYLTDFGHMVCISGYTDDSVVLQDPYGNPNTGYKFNDGNKLDDGNTIVLDKRLLPKLNYLIVFE